LIGFDLIVGLVGEVVRDHLPPFEPFIFRLSGISSSEEAMSRNARPGRSVEVELDKGRAR